MFYKKYGKRACDIALSIIGLPVFALIGIPTAIAIKIEDRGPVFYNALRLGKDEKIFKMYKFRSMKVNAPDLRNNDGSTFNAENDPRLTKVGKFIRKTSIDETPQLFNILKGEMSFIGPRPDLPEHLKQYEGNEKRKLEIKPGISGYSQAYYRNSIEWKKRIKNDIDYIDNLTFLLDLKILVKTIQIIFKKENVFIDGVQTLEKS
ncbi:MAG: sugar transferase [Eubacterium sp.]